MKSLSKRSKTLLVLIGLSLPFASCKKEQATTVEIAVLDIEGNRIQNAMVRLWPNPDPVLAVPIDADTAYTQDDGYARFDYTGDFNLGQAGFRVLDIEVRANDTLYGEGIIKIIEEQNNKETVIVTAI